LKRIRTVTKPSERGWGLDKGSLQGRGPGRRPLAGFGSIPDAYLDVLNGAGQVILDLHPPEPPPACPIVTIALGAGEGSFHEMFSFAQVAVGR